MKIMEEQLANAIESIVVSVYKRLKFIQCVILYLGVLTNSYIL